MIFSQISGEMALISILTAVVKMAKITAKNGTARMMARTVTVRPTIAKKTRGSIKLAGQP